ncbi:MAG: GntR family transcriptional regulator [Janthinobacterium lividum]
MRLQDDICSTLREDILACRLPPGTELREQALAARLGVSKSPVREALLRLSQERLVSIQPRQGYRVTPVPLTAAAELLELRRVLELACVRAAASRAGAAQREALCRAADYSGDADGFIAYNRRFHSALAGCCGNARMAQAATDAVAQGDRLVHLSLGMLQGRNPDRLVAEHIELAAAVAEGDGRRAVRLLRVHLETAERRILDALRRTTDAAASGAEPRGNASCPEPPRD